MEMIFVSSLLEVDKFLDFFPSLSQKKICDHKKSDDKNEHVVLYICTNACVNKYYHFNLLLPSSHPTVKTKSRRLARQLQRLVLSFGDSLRRSLLLHLHHLRLHLLVFARGVVVVRKQMVVRVNDNKTNNKTND